MAEVKILIKGYSSEDNHDNGTCPTITIVKDKNIIMVVDPGLLKDKKQLIDSLKKENLEIDNITHVCITHSHMDHYRNIGMFPNAEAIDFWGNWKSDQLTPFKEQFSDNIKIIKTPGHSYDSITLLVKTEEGITAICGDVFWKKDYPKEDQYAQDKETLEISRKKLLTIADKIVPGHGDIFTT